jgi:hypothetical protein
MSSSVNYSFFTKIGGVFFHCVPVVRVDSASDKKETHATTIQNNQGQKLVANSALKSGN